MIKPNHEKHPETGNTRFRSGCARITRALLLALMTTLLLNSAFSETKFVDGWRDGIWTAYVIIEHNGRQYRSDEMSPAWNASAWQRLSDSDKRKVAKTFMHMQNHIRDQFGVQGQRNINSFWNRETGWADLVEAMKEKHANKNYPELHAAFGDHVTLDVPSYWAACWTVFNSPDYLEAVRLDKEIRADFVVGRRIYQNLVNAKWEQIGVAVQGLSGPLIRIIVDNFISGFVTQGASATSELMAAIYNFQEELRNDIAARSDPTQAASDPAAVIKRLEQFLGEMETVALTAVSRVEANTAKLEALAAKIKEADAKSLKERRAEAGVIRTNFFEKIDIRPNPVSISTNVKTPRQHWFELEDDARDLKQQLLAEQAALWAIHTNAAEIELSADIQLSPDGFTSGFDTRYRLFKAELEVIDQVQLYPLENADTTIAVYEYTVPAAEQAIDDAIARIDPLEARARGLDAYADELGFTPSQDFQLFKLRDLETYVNIIASADKTTEKIIEDIVDKEEFSQEAQNRVPDGRSKRITWLSSQVNIYNSLRFNFEASLSYAIEALRLLDELHADPYYKPIPHTTYAGTQLYVYRVDMDYIFAEIEDYAKGDPTRNLKARERALQRLITLYAQERALIARLETARTFNENDKVVLDNFFASLRRGYGFSDFVGANDRVIEDVRKATGTTIYLPDDLAAAGVRHPSDYRDLAGNWVRGIPELSVNIHHYDEHGFIASPVQQLTGKTPTYFDLLELYDYMGSARSALLALSPSAFEEFAVSSMDRILAAQEFMRMEGVDYPGSPGRLLAFASFLRRGNIVSEYNNRHVDDEPQSVYGWVVTENNVGIPGVVVTLVPDPVQDGLTGRSAVSGANGWFEVDLVWPGRFKLTAHHEAYGFAPGMYMMEMQNAGILLFFQAIPNDVTGYSISGMISDENRNGIDGFTVALRSDSNPEDVRITLTQPDGTYAFIELEPGRWTVEPFETDTQTMPATRSIDLHACVANINFVVDTATVPAHRFYSFGAPESTYVHLWTINGDERDALKSWPSWQYEGIAWHALRDIEPGATPLYRLYEPNIRRHLYTINPEEYIALENASWNGEGVQYFVYPSDLVQGLVPVYRFYHASNQNHHFTTDANEKDTIIATPEWGYAYEGIAFYVFMPD